MAIGLREPFLLDPAVTYLNHGAYGATPRPVFESYQRWQRELEREPVDFISRKGTERLAHSRAVLAEYLGTERDNLVYVNNGTVGLNIVARSLRLGPGDELLTTDHEHGGIDRLFRFMAEKLGFKLVKYQVGLPVTTHQEFVDRFMSHVTPRTRVILISHLTSPTSLVFPVREICARARAAGIQTIIDGSHVPGQLALALPEVDPDFYVGILHKWLCAPKGCAFLYVRPSAQDLLDPLVVSWGWEPKNPGPSKFVEYHEWQGSRDFSAYLSVPARSRFSASTTGTPSAPNAAGSRSTPSVRSANCSGSSRIIRRGRSGTARSFAPGCRAVPTTSRCSTGFATSTTSTFRWIASTGRAFGSRCRRITTWGISTVCSRRFAGVVWSIAERARDRQCR